MIVSFNLPNSLADSWKFHVDAACLRMGWTRSQLIRDASAAYAMQILEHGEPDGPVVRVGISAVCSDIVGGGVPICTVTAASATSADTLCAGVY